MRNVLPLLKGKLMYSDVDFLPIPLLVASFKSPGLTSPCPPQEIQSPVSELHHSTLTPEHFQTMRRVWHLGLNATDTCQHHTGS